MVTASPAAMLASGGGLVSDRSAPQPNASVATTVSPAPETSNTSRAERRKCAMSPPRAARKRPRAPRVTSTAAIAKAARISAARRRPGVARPLRRCRGSWRLPAVGRDHAWRRHNGLCRAPLGSTITGLSGARPRRSGLSQRRREQTLWRNRKSPGHDGRASPRARRREFGHRPTGQAFLSRRASLAAGRR